MCSGGVGDSGPGDRVLGALQARVRHAALLAKRRALVEQHRLRVHRRGALRRRHFPPRRARALRRAPTVARAGASFLPVHFPSGRLSSFSNYSNL